MAMDNRNLINEYISGTLFEFVPNFIALEDKPFKKLVKGGLIDEQTFNPIREEEDIPFCNLTRHSGELKLTPERYKEETLNGMRTVAVDMAEGLMYELWYGDGFTNPNTTYKGTFGLDLQVRTSGIQEKVRDKDISQLGPVLDKLATKINDQAKDLLLTKYNIEWAVVTHPDLAASYFSCPVPVITDRFIRTRQMGNSVTAPIYFLPFLMKYDYDLVYREGLDLSLNFSSSLSEPFYTDSGGSEWKVKKDGFDIMFQCRVKSRPCLHFPQLSAKVEGFWFTP